MPPFTPQALGNAGSWLSSVHSQLSHLQSVVSLEYGVPAVLLVLALLVSALWNCICCSPRHH